MIVRHNGDRAAATNETSHLIVFNAAIDGENATRTGSERLNFLQKKHFEDKKSFWKKSGKLHFKLASKNGYI